MYKCLIEGSYNLEKYIAQMHNDIKNMILSYTIFAVLLNLNTDTIVYNNTFLFTSLIVLINTEKSHGF